MRLLMIGLLSGLLASGPAACSRHAESASQPKAAIRVLCSTFPMYLFTRAVTQGQAGVQVELMIPAGMGCPHEYALTPQDMQKIASANVFIANGLGMEEFLGEPLKKANDKLIVIDTSEGVGDLIVLSPEPQDEHKRQAAPKEEGHHHAGSNPHLFASPKLAARIVANIAAGLARIDPAGAELYRRNAQAYADKLTQLGAEFASALKDAPKRKIVTEHAVFDYLARDCGLEIVAVVEEEPGQEPSASEMLDLVKSIKASAAAAMFTEPQYPAKVSRTIAREVGIPVAVLDPVANGPDNAAPDYYEKTMRANLATLIQVLGSKVK